MEPMGIPYMVMGSLIWFEAYSLTRDFGSSGQQLEMLSLMALQSRYAGIMCVYIYIYIYLFIYIYIYIYI